MTTGDTGQTVIQMGIADRYQNTDRGRRPAVGARFGVAVYEVAESRREAFWLDNTWQGTYLGSTEVDDHE